MLVLVATARPGVRSEQIIDAMREQVTAFVQRSVAPRELQKSLNIEEAEFVMGLDAVRDRVHRLSLFHALTGSAQHMNEYLTRFQNVNANIVRSTSAAFLGVEPIVLEILPEDSP
jgi:predicted Zn-dependent peptidase